MKYNICYHHLAPTAEPDPRTVEGVHSLVERFYSLKGTEGVPGGATGSGGVTSLSVLPTTKSKRLTVIS